MNMQDEWKMAAQALECPVCSRWTGNDYTVYHLTPICKEGAD